MDATLFGNGFITIEVRPPRDRGQSYVMAGSTKDGPTGKDGEGRRIARATSGRTTLRTEDGAPV